MLPSERMGRDSAKTFPSTIKTTVDDGLLHPNPVTIAGVETMRCLKQCFGFTGDWIINDQNDLLRRFFGLQKVNQHENACDRWVVTAY